MANPRLPTAAGVLPHSGLGLGMPTTTPLPTRQWTPTRPRAFQVVPINWRPDGPQLTFGAADAPAAAGASPCEDC